MMMSYYLNKHARREPSLNSREHKSLILKRNLCIVNVVSILLATYFFIRHNERCEGGSEYQIKTPFGHILVSISYLFIKLTFEHFMFNFSLHAFRILRIYCRAHQHGLSSNVNLWLSWPAIDIWLEEWCQMLAVEKESINVYFRSHTKILNSYPSNNNIKFD